MKKLFFLFLTGLFSCSPLYAQSVIPHIEWEKSYGGSDMDIPTSMAMTADKGFIIAGYSASDDQDVAGHHGTTDLNDYWIIKLDSNGSIQWQKSFGGTDDDLATSIKQTSDGGYIVAGHSRSTDGDVSNNTARSGDNYWILRLNDNGNILWQNTYGGSGDDVAENIGQTDDGGFIAIGYSYSDDQDITNHHGTSSSADYWIIKLNSLGNIQWQRSYGGSGDDIGYDIRQTPDHGYVAVGYSNSIDGDVTTHHGLQDYWVVKLDSIGNLQWEKSYGGTGNDNALSFDLTNDHGYILTGFSASNDSDVTANHGQTDFWVVKLDSGGTLQWEKSLGGSAVDAGYSIQQSLDGGYIACGISSSNDSEVTGNHGGNDYWITKLDGLGNLLWQKSLGGPEEDFATCILQTPDSSYVLAGSSDGDGGDVTGNHGHEDYWIVKLGLKPVNSVRASNTTSNEIANFPNPFGDKTQIRFSKSIESPTELMVYNVLGEKVKRIKILPGTEILTITRGDLPAGVYFYYLVSDGTTTAQGRMVIQ